ncbi:hypothetical protein NPIL_648901 [Nephila pilipes]|uniref:Uncharacterized protein n=1 Tax=Nephila pilipes TaxID=299642 RepID=A0A8X6TWA8_NEPPI|nr:hypothetical protein NPIL_648901 [Nephila pilipes]
MSQSFLKSAYLNQIEPGPQTERKTIGYGFPNSETMSRVKDATLAVLLLRSYNPKAMSGENCWHLTIWSHYHRLGVWLKQKEESIRPFLKTDYSL